VGRPLDVKEVTRVLVGCMDAGYDRLLAGGCGELEAAWADRLGLVGRPVTAELWDAVEVRGRLAAVGFDGVQMELPGGTVRRLRPEEVRHLRP
jgi:hypothetical protein